MKKILMGLIATLMFTFVGNAQSLRAKFLEGKKSKEEIVQAYNNLSENDQKMLWMEKIDQLISLNLPTEHKNLILKIRAGLDQGVNEKQGAEFLDTAAKLARITPMQDFGNMFEKLEDYNYNGKFTDTNPVTEKIINSIMNINLFQSETTSKAPCSCRWCIGISNPGHNCRKTSSGCGFLWIQECDSCVFCL